MVIGSIIGTGVFFKSAIMAQELGSPRLVLLAWLAAGLLALAGALSYAELGGMLPHAGGDYVYLRTAYGDATSFLYGWMRFVVASAGSSALAVGFVTFLGSLVPLGHAWATTTLHPFGSEFRWEFGLREVIAVALILLLGGINCVGVAMGGRVQTALTAGKILGILIIVGGAFFFAKGGSAVNFQAPAGAAHWSGIQAFGAAMIAALWACDGWAFMPMVSSEVKNPERNVPRALIIGMLAVVTLYGLANLAYFYALPFNEVATANSTRFRDAAPLAAKAAQTFLGARGTAIVTALFMISAAGALNGVLLGTSRVPFAMARDGLFFKRFGELGRKSRVPVWSLIALSIWSSVLAVSGTYDQLTNLVVFGEWIFYLLVAAAVIVLRRKMPDAARPYRTLGYPVVPLIFVAVAVWLILNTLWTNSLEALTGCVLIAAGLPFYFHFRHRARQSS